jgi:hypothetical protein
VSKIVKKRTKNVQNRQKSHQNRSKTFTNRAFFLSINSGVRRQAQRDAALDQTTPMLRQLKGCVRKEDPAQERRQGRHTTRAV